MTLNIDTSVFTPFDLPVLPRIPGEMFDIRDFGAIPGGKALNTRSIQTTIEAAYRAGGGQVVIPSGIWLTGPIHFRSRIELHLESGAELRFSDNPEDYLPAVLSQRGGTMIYNYSPFIYAYGCEDIALTGKGVLHGQGTAWWHWKYSQPGMMDILVHIPEKNIPLDQRRFGTREAGVRPVFFQPIECERLLVDGVTFRDSPSWTLQPVWCRELTLRHITVTNPPAHVSHNTDGIDPDACRNVLIEHCDINTGDDAICLKAGRGPDAWKDGRPCENVLIRHCRVRSGHGGIVIGSEMSAGVRNVHVHDCLFDGTDRGVRIKSKPSRGGFVKEILIERIQMKRIQLEAIDINLHYDGNKEETLDLDNLADVPDFRDITLRDVDCESAGRSIIMTGLPSYPIRNVVLDNVRISAVEAARVTREVAGLQETNVEIRPLPDRRTLTDMAVDPEIATARHLTDSIESPRIEFPPEKRPMAGRNTAPISHPDAAPPLVLRWKQIPGDMSPMTLRITAAVDERTIHRVAVANASTGERFGVIEVFFACPGQVFELPLTKEQADAAFTDGLALSLTEEVSTFWIVTAGPNAPDPILPHLLGKTTPATTDRFLSLFCSPTSLQPCDWMEICVLDGLWDWTARGRTDARTMLRHHLRTFLDPVHGKRENIRGEPCDGEPGGPESTGPFAILALVDPAHPALRLADDGFEKHFCEITQSVGHRVVAETSYNIAYPMMAMALRAGRAELRDRALHQLEVNRRYLTEPDALWLRHSPGDGLRTFPNWSRGIAWYLLGLVRTLALLPAHERPASLVEEIERVADWVGRYQRDDGLWPCFLKEPETAPDTSGSSGIAAAIAIAANIGLADPHHRLTALRARDGLLKKLTPDGWLTGVSQSNKREAAEIDLQRTKWRVIAPWGMGLFAQLLAAVESSPTPTA